MTNVNVSPELQAEISAAICRPEGSLTFEYSSVQAFKKEQHPRLLLQIPAGGHLFRLERVEGRRLQFFHASPGTGTRVATIDLADLPDFDKAFLAFTSSPQEVCFYCGPRVPGTALLSAKAEQSSRQFQVGADGSVHQIGDVGVEMMGVRVRRAGQRVLEPTAIQAWGETLKAIEVLETGKSDQGFIFETALAAVTLSVLVIGLEAYAKARFIEVETEGIVANWRSVFEEFSSRADRDATRVVEFESEAASRGVSPLRALVDGRKINFQNFDHVKRAFRAAYGIKIGEVRVSSQVLTALTKFIHYRHRIVHVSPLLGMLNDDEIPPAEPVFANRALTEQALKCFGEVVAALHQATLQLRPAR
jgi:hypothetical protein